ncbi:hypothetical protein EV198_3216 [Roseivirga ehrenbergii]|uniref:DUF8202 domain-containing protein n=1 Tax=Roseivirga ehrenbergii (strain DSM 102268 / JCM 13514 / KCTC 12282 / NCIMB 14502 / KMM 6017) TaxID=279360 RepID=A0A150XC65_ROSEK|nr:hypothetical protein [Roseivirga ehrenbergii]KYG76272.1 hypothetical protein MB14_03215 [Roseivirga ehrenbergii]TCL00199.1 hypothetical protein EV198_3216 [Roseivirga ehrenbergii]
MRYVDLVGTFFGRVILGVLLLCFINTALLGQSHITSINYASPLPTSIPSTVSVTSPSDAINDIQPSLPYDLYYGTGDNLKIKSYTVGGKLYDNFVLPDTLVIKRTDNQAYINVWYTLSSIVDPSFSPLTPGELELDADEVEDADALYQSGVLNAGYDNIMVNEDDEGLNTIQAQVERLDVIWFTGLVTCEPDSAVFPIIERGGNDEIKIAAILSLDVNGEPASYGSMIDIEDSDWPDPSNSGTGGGRSFDNFLILRRQDTGLDPTPIINIGTFFGQSAQSLQGVAVSFSELGIAANTVIYGFSIFAFDTNATDHDLTDIFTFPTDTKASDSGLDLVAGLSAGVSSDNCLTPGTGPGGYKAALTTWLKANVGVTTATDGSTVTDWQDQWVGNHDATTGVAAPTYRSTTSNINFNPTVDFTTGSTSLTIANNLAFNTGGPYTKKGINLAFRTSTSDINTRQVLYEQGGSDRGITVYIRDGKLHLSSWNRTSDGSGSPWNTSANVATIASATLSENTEYIVTLEFSGNTSSTGTVTGYLNGQSFATLNNVGLLYSDTDGIEFGASDGASRYDNGSSSSANSYYGEISELIYCNEPGAFLISQRNRIESYLAVKYGITLDQATPINYVDSQGDIVFNTTLNASLGGYLEYNKDIAGIARDDNSEFEQVKSRSENMGSVVTMDHGGSFPDNNSWLIWGNDSGDKDDDETTDVPPLITKRVERVWRVAETGETGNNSISFDISGFTFSGGTPSESDYSLLIAGNSSGGDFSSAQVITGGTLSGSTITFSGVNFENGQYFTLGTGFISCGPGNVTTNLTLWLRADNGPNTTVNGADVTSWGDFSGSNDANDATNYPNYVSNSINFNPALNFDITNSEWMSGSAGFYTTAYYFVFKADNEITTGSTPQTVIGFDAPSASVNIGGFTLGNIASGSELFTHVMGTTNTWYRRANDTAGRPKVLAGESLLLGVRNNATNTSTQIYINGEQRDDASTGTFKTSSNVAYRLANFRAFFSRAYDGQIAELISFSVRPDDTNEHLRIQSYLAIKYGITLDQTTGQNYLNSSSSVIWNATDNASYKKDIAGIGRDDGSCFIQRQSKSVNDGAIVTIGLGGIAADNKSNLNSFSADESFMVWGNDNADKEQSNAVNAANDGSPDVPAGVTERMRRVWRVDETGTVGNTTISFDLTGLGYSSSAADFKLIRSASSTMASGTTVGGGTFNGNVLTFENVDFADGDYFTLGTAIELCGPGGVTTGLAMWLKANNGPDAIINDATVNTWTDKSTSDNDGAVTPNGVSPVLPKLKTATFNFNPVVRFSDPGTSDLAYISTDNGNVVSDDMTLATVFSTTQNGGNTGNFEDSPVLMSSGKSGGTADYALGLADNGAVHFNAANNSSRTAYSTAKYNNGIPHIAMGTRVKAVSGAVELYMDAANVGSGTSDNVSLNGGTAMGIGNNGAIADYTINSQLQGNIAEVLAYSRVLTANERVRVDSYLALKYGITRAGGTGEKDYLASDSGVVWDWTEQPTYNYNISGLARDDDSCFLQETSKSSNAGTIVKMASVSGIGVDDSFSIWGSENKPLTGTKADGNTEFNTSQVKSRLFREWYVQETGTVGQVDLTFDLFSIGGPSGVGTNNLNLVRLMLDADGDFTSGVTLQAPTSIDAVKKTVTFRVDLTDTQFFTLGATEKYALPITLISFDAKNINNESVQLNWTTASEEGNAYYTIERSANGKDFTAIGVLNGAGNSDEILNYIYSDSEPLSGTSYYRLKQTDFNGEFEYSEVKRVLLNKAQLEINTAFSVFPNPVVFGEKFKLAYRVAEDQEIELQVVTSSGVVVSSSSFEIKAASGHIELDSKDLPKGLNMIRIIDRDRKVVTIKMLVR